MSALPYEVPIYVEHRRQPRSVVVALLTGIIAEAFLGALCFWAQRGFHWQWLPLLTIWPISLGIALLALVIASYAAVRGQVAVYGDHLVASQSLIGLTIYRRRVRWSAIRRCEIRRRSPCGKSKSDGLVQWFGSSIFMCDGDGVRLFLVGFSEFVIGSADPDRLLAAITAARSPADPAAGPQGSAGGP